MSLMKIIEESDFVDLYVGDTYCDIKGLSGTSATRVSAPSEWADAVVALRLQCKETFAAEGDAEFSMIVGDVVFRVTQMCDVDNTDVFILRRSAAQIRALDSIGLPDHISKAVQDKERRGLVLIAGEMGAGKTSTAASIVRNWLLLHGGIGLTVEDPPETKLNGVHGLGRCIQVRASRKTGGYKEHMMRAMRSGADLILIGEIRNAETATEAVQAGVNGQRIFATIHAGDIGQAIQRLCSLCTVPDAYSVVADGLAAIIFLSMERVPRQNAPGFSSRLLVKGLVLDADSKGIRTKIRTQQIALIQQDVDIQSRQVAWNQKK